MRDRRGYSSFFFSTGPDFFAPVRSISQSIVCSEPVYAGTITLLGLGLFIFVMAAEPYLRNGIARRQLLRRFLRLAIPVAIAAVIGLLVLVLIGQIP